VAPVAMMIVMLMMQAKIAPRHRVQAGVAVLVRTLAAVDNARCGVELHVGADRCADKCDSEQQVVLGVQEMGQHQVRADRPPVRVPEDRRDRVREEPQRHDQEDPLGVAVRAEHHQGPNRDRGRRDHPVAVDVHQFERGPDAGELADDQAGVGHQHGDEGDAGQPQAELLADQGRQTFAGEYAESDRHLLHDHQCDRDQHHEEQGAVDELAAPHHGRPKRDGLERLYRHDVRVARWAGTAHGVIQAISTYEHHESTVRGVGRAERNMLKTVTGEFGTLDRESWKRLSAILV
jgi:hypothetical protein